MTPDYLFYSCACFVLYPRRNVLWKEHRFFFFFPFSFPKKKKKISRHIKVSDTPSLHVCDQCCADAKDKNSSESFERALWPGPPRLWCGLALKEPLVPGRVNIHMERSVRAQEGRSFGLHSGGVENDLSALVTSAKKDRRDIRASSARGWRGWNFKTQRTTTTHKKKKKTVMRTKWASRAKSPI